MIRAAAERGDQARLVVLLRQALERADLERAQRVLAVAGLTSADSTRLLSLAVKGLPAAATLRPVWLRASYFPGWDPLGLAAGRELAAATPDLVTKIPELDAGRVPLQPPARQARLMSLLIDLGSNPATNYSSRGIMRREQGDLEGALADLDRAIQLSPGLAAAYHNRSTVRFERNDLEGALADSSRAIELDPDREDTYSNRAMARSRLGDLEGAIADLTRVLELRPKNAEIHCARAELRLAQGDLEGALSDLERALQHDPEFQPAQWLLPLALLRRGNARGAGDAISSLQARHPGQSGALLLRAVWHRDRGETVGALQELERALATLQAAPHSTQTAETRMARAITAFLAGDLPAAEKDFQAVAGMDLVPAVRRSGLPYLEAAGLGLALVHAARGDSDRARAEILPLLARYPGRVLARWATRSVTPLADRLVALLPEHPLAWAERGVLYLVTARPREALADLERALALTRQESAPARLVPEIERWILRARRAQKR